MRNMKKEDEAVSSSCEKKEAKKNMQQKLKKILV